MPTQHWDWEKYYTETRRLANDNIVRNQQGLDHIVFAVAAGALLLSIDLWRSSNGSNSQYWYLLLTSWTFLLAALLFHSLSHRVVVKLNKRIVKELDERDIARDHSPYQPYAGGENECAESFDNLAFMFMIAGIIALGIYLFVGLIPG